MSDGEPSRAAHILSKIESARSDFALADETLDRIGEDDEARRWIAKTIIWIFTGSVAAVLLLLLVQGWRTDDWESVATRASDLIKSAVLPVVTLVLGYYFGRAGK